MLGSLLIACPPADPRPRQASRADAGRELQVAVAAALPPRLQIPAGSFESGTPAGEFERLPAIEPRVSPISLGAFEIDTMPYPGGGATPLTGITRARARALCEERSGRLCTELEWERACKGPTSSPFPTGATFDGRCAASPTACASGFGVRGFGVIREWTASDVSVRGQAIARGASPEAPPSAHRCAHRSTANARVGAPDLGFRCCYGPPNAAAIEQPTLGATFSKVSLPLAELERLLMESPVTRPLATELAYFNEADAVRRVLARGPGDAKGFLFTASPLSWNPVTGADFLIVSARSGKDTSFVVAFHELGAGRRRLAASFIMRREPGPIALAYNGYIRPRLHFSSCWGCPGETGKILYRDPDQVAILQP